MMNLGSYQGSCLHSNSSDHISAVPEAYVAGILAPLRRVPRHDEQIELHQNVEYNNRLPRLELGSRQVCTPASPPHHIQTNSHRQVEGG